MTATREAIAQGAPGGGFILSPVDSLNGSTPWSSVETLIAAYNPQAAAGVMCRTTLSVDWTGRLHDCDFNQMLELGLESGLPQTIHEFDVESLAHRPIKTGQHCYGCTAGAGSGCRGAITAS